MSEEEKELERRRSRIVDISREDEVNLDDYVGTWKSCGFSRGIGRDKWRNDFGSEDSTLRYLQFFPNGDLWVTGDWTSEESCLLDRRNVRTIKELHSWDGKDTVHMYSKVDHPEKRDFRLVRQEGKLYFHRGKDTYYVLGKASDDPEIKLIR